MSKISQKLKAWALKILVYALEGLIYIKRFTVLLLFLLASVLKYPAHLFLEHFILPLYRLYLFLRRTVFRAPIQKIKNLYSFVFPKFLIHIGIITIAAATIGSNISAQISPLEDFGKKNLLTQIASEDDSQGDLGYFVEEVGPYVPPKQYIERKNYLSAISKEERKAEETYVAPPPTEGYIAVENPEFYTIPETRKDIVEYTILPGDTISDLAEQFGISINTILWANKLSVSSALKPGQKLQILPVTGIMYKIAKGDQLDKIATKYKSDREKILAFNTGLDPSNMVAGQTIIIPDGVMPYTAPPRPTVASPSAVFAPSPEALANIQMIWPSSCKRITQYYKWNHAGIDIGCPFGVPIYASDEGIVEYAGWGNGGWGNTIVINHGDGRKTRYSHASKILVTKGEFVAKGQVIMLEGSTGHSTGPHLDFRIYINGQTVNPLSYVR